MSDVPQNRPQPPEKPSLFIEGYLTDLYRSGWRPKNHYPPSSLPDAKGRVMEVETSWFAARKPKDAEPVDVKA